MSDPSIEPRQDPPPWPFMCGPTADLPPGWVRGDPARNDPNQLGVAYDPKRHTVVSVLHPGASDRLATAGFTPLLVADDPATALIFVRDRAADQTRRRPSPSPPQGRSR